MQLDRRGAELLFLALTEREETSSEALPTWLSGLSGVRRGGATKG
jgi:hypothetical protein